MNKKVVVIAVLSLAVLTLSLAGYAFAQGQPPSSREHPYGFDMMNGYGGYDHEMMGWNGEEGPMHEAMIDALAESLALSPEEIETRHDAGETLWDIAEAEGLNDDEIRDLMFSSHGATLAAAVTEGWLAPEQADWMDEHMNQMWDGDYDHCGGGRGNGSGARRHGMNW
jgi:hypothetical protein